MNKIKYASVRPFWIATANVLLFENVHYAVNCSEVLDLNVHASFINAAIHLTVKMLVLLQCQQSSAYVIMVALCNRADHNIFIL